MPSNAAMVHPFSQLCSALNNMRAIVNSMNTLAPAGMAKSGAWLKAPRAMKVITRTTLKILPLMWFCQSTERRISLS